MLLRFFRVLRAAATASTGALLILHGAWSGQAAGQDLASDRAYELVSPAAKGGGEVTGDGTRTRAAEDGSAVMFVSLLAFGDAAGTGIATEYVSRRHVDGQVQGQGWGTHAITPSQPGQGVVTAPTAGEAAFQGFTANLASGVYHAWSPLTPDPNVEDVANLYRRHDVLAPGAGAYELVSACPICASPLPVFFRLSPTWFAGGSPDLGHILFESSLNLAEGANGFERKLYEWDQGTLRLAGVLPDGTGAPRSMAGLGISQFNALRITYRPISNDGSRLVFTVSSDGLSNTGAIYMRINGRSTVQLNASERAVPDSPQEANYWTASTDHRRVFFTTSEALTDDVVGGGVKLYMWERQTDDEDQQVTVDATGGTFTLAFNGQTTADIPFDASPVVVQRALEALTTVGPGNMTVAGGPGSAGGGTPYVVTFTDDFAGANVAQLDASGAGLSGGAASVGVSTTDPVRNLTYINDPPVGAPDALNSAQGVIGASEDGRRIYFIAFGQLVPGQPALGGDFGLYYWDDGAIAYVGEITDFGITDGLLTGRPIVGDLLQVRTSPDGRYLLFPARSGDGLLSAHGGVDQDQVGFRQLYLYEADGGALRCVSCLAGVQSTATADATVNRSTGAAGVQSYVSRALSDGGGRVFFSTAQALVPQDVNNRVDAYEYDRATGRQHLLSSGTNPSNSYFLDASVSGDDVFFVTRERLVGWDRDDSYDLYDARVGGGVPEPPAPPAICSGDACQGAPGGGPAVAAAGSATYRGAGNARPTTARARARPRGRRCRRGRARRRVRGRVRCVRVVKRERSAAAKRRTR